MVGGGFQGGQGGQTGWTQAPTGSSTPGGSTQTSSGTTVYQAQGGSYTTYIGVGTRTPVGGGATEYADVKGGWSPTPPAGAIKTSSGNYIIETKPEGQKPVTTTTTREVPIDYSGKPITPPSTLQESFKADVFSVSYPGVSPALNAYTVGLTGWGSTPAGQSFLPMATETTTTMYTPVGLSNIFSDIKPEYESTTYFRGGVPISTEKPLFGDIPGTWKATEMKSTFQNIGVVTTPSGTLASYSGPAQFGFFPVAALNQLFSVDITKGIPKGLTAVSGYLWTPPKITSFPRSKPSDSGVFTGPFFPAKNIGTRQDANAPISLPGIDTRTMLSAVIPKFNVLKTSEQEWKEYYTNPLAHLDYIVNTAIEFPKGFIGSVAAGTVGLPGSISNLVSGGTQGLFYAKEGLINRAWDRVGKDRNSSLDSEGSLRDRRFSCRRDIHKRVHLQAGNREVGNAEIHRNNCNEYGKGVCSRHKEPAGSRLAV